MSGLCRRGVAGLTAAIGTLLCCYVAALYGTQAALAVSHDGSSSIAQVTLSLAFAVTPAAVGLACCHSLRRREGTHKRSVVPSASLAALTAIALWAVLAL
jgi:hypothetical protein